MKLKLFSCHFYNAEDLVKNLKDANYSCKIFFSATCVLAKEPETANDFVELMSAIRFKAPYRKMSWHITTQDTQNQLLDYLQKYTESLMIEEKEKTIKLYC